MTKLLKILGRIVGVIFEWSLITVILFSFFIRTSPVQSFLAHKATAFLSNELNTTIKVDKVAIVFFDRVALDGVMILDKQKDTLASLETVYLTINKLDLKKQILELGHAELDKGTIHINRNKQSGDYNYWFFTDYFSGGKHKQSNKPFAVTLHSFQLSDIHFKYDDFRKSYSTYGVDYDHIDLHHLYLSITDFCSKNDVFTGKITQLKTREKSGFKLDSFSADATVSEKGVKLKKLQIETPNSSIYFPKFELLMNKYADFLEFEDRVSFNAQLNKSNVSLKDVSYFATYLEGMNQRIELSALVKNKVKNLSISKLRLKTGQKSMIKGTIILPDFRNFENEHFKESIDFAYIAIQDLKNIRLPNHLKNKYLTFDKYLERLSFFQVKKLKLQGYYSRFNITAGLLNTKIGALKINNKIQFQHNPSAHSYTFQKSDSTNYDFTLKQFRLNEFLADENYGITDGNFNISGEIFSSSDIRFDHISGKVNQFTYLGYDYQNIDIKEGNFVDQKLQAKIDIHDDNLNLIYDGFIDFNGAHHILFTVDLTKAFLDNLNITHSDSTSLTSKFTVDITGNNSNSMSGKLHMNGLVYKEGSQSVFIPELTIAVNRSEHEDNFTINSDLATIKLSGKIDFSTILYDISTQLLKVFPSIAELRHIGYSLSESHNKFSYSVTVHEMTDLLAIFAPGLTIAQGTTLKGRYDGKSELFNLDLNSPLISYKNLKFEGVNFTQNLSSQKINANYNLRHFIFNDSTTLDNVYFETNGENNQLNSFVSWNQKQQNESLISWKTNILSSNHIEFTLIPSYFSINKQRWDIVNEAGFNLINERVSISNFKVEKDNQYLTLDGSFSDSDEDKLRFHINEINLKELSDFFGSQYEMKGSINGWGYISTPFTQFNFLGDATIHNFYLDKKEVGDIYLQSQWDKPTNSLAMTGNLVYKGNQTFEFEGRYLLGRKTNNLDFNLIFDHTDISFTDAFIDPEVLNSIHGELDGTLKINGTPESPILNGNVELLHGSTKVETLGITVALSGTINADETGFYINNMPVTDEEGNTGSLIGSVYHKQFKNWNYDIQIDLEPQVAANFPYHITSQHASLDKFLVLKTNYKEGDYYFGKAYATGTANIFGYDDNVEITLDFETQKGTFIHLPMYGVSELSEEESFITFKQKNETKIDSKNKINYNGLSLNLNFRLNQDAKVQIIFNEQTEDEITATGSGNIALNLNNIGELKMDGVYRVKTGIYNFALGPIKKPFYLDEGGSIIWTGDPYNATVDLKTYYSVRANLKELAPDQFQNSTSTTNQDVYCYLGLTESLMKPTISFDIKAPKADESGKALISRVTGDKDELNRQFFSLLLWKRFQPLKGGTAASSSAAADLAANQINSVLDKVSKDYKMNLHLNTDEVTGEKAMEFNLSKRFLEDRLIVSGSFGVESNSITKLYNKNGLIGDVNIEYLLNESGNIRVNIFNESNDYSVIQYRGLFTQGAGIHYREDFDKLSQFKLVQNFFDVFRKNKRIPIKKKKRQSPVPYPDSLTVGSLNNSGRKNSFLISFLS